jgi:hypothetical protein
LVVTILASSQLLAPVALVRDFVRPHRDTPSVVDTTELRWFFPGVLPHDIDAWFTSSTGIREERFDTYLLDGDGDIGVKRRFGKRLELKVRQSLGGWVDLGHGLAGSLEVWRKWSPAEALRADVSEGLPLDVRKSIFKRRFSMDGTEIAISSDAQPVGAGCDVEITSVTVGAVHAWTFAFEAFGPPAIRRDALLAAWQGLVAAAPCPQPFGPRTGRAMAYPEWLALAVCSDRRSGSRHRSAVRAR